MSRFIITLFEFFSFVENGLKSLTKKALPGVPQLRPQTIFTIRYFRTTSSRSTRKWTDPTARPAAFPSTPKRGPTTSIIMFQSPVP